MKTHVVLGVAAALVSAGGGSLYGRQWWRDHRDAGLVRATAQIDPSKCSDPKLPIWVEVFNGSHRTITHTSFHLSAQRPGTSLDLADFTRAADYQVPPQKRLFGCAAPKLKPEAWNEDLRALEWAIGLREVRFAD